MENSHNPTGDAVTIQLDQFLKLAGLLRTGRQAQVVTQADEVTVTGELEASRRRTLYAGDRVAWNGEELVVEFEQ